MADKILIKSSDFSTITKGTSYTIQFWAGEVAEVSLVSVPTNALQTLARVTRGYTGYYENQDVPYEQLLLFLEDLKKTKLGTPLEFLNFVFLIRDVPRSFTHQIVRTRLASYVQESTRFIGACSLYKILVPATVLENGSIRAEYFEGTVSAICNYAQLVEREGVSSQDARNLLPHSLLTHLFWSIDLKSLMTVYNQRWCCQAEESSWLPVMRQVKQLISNTCGTNISGLLTAPIDRGESCGFNASFDRPCVWQNKSVTQ